MVLFGPATSMSLDEKAVFPSEYGKNLHACIPCRLVKTFEQFLDTGCENCPFLGMEGDRQRCLDCTTSAFQGMVTIIDPSSSWLAKWLHKGNFVPGCYALSVEEFVPEHFDDILEGHKSVD